jgi:hypothetical protein
MDVVQITFADHLAVDLERERERDPVLVGLSKPFVELGLVLDE